MADNDEVEIEEGPKYVVFKREDWPWPNTGEHVSPQPLDDAVVIRLKDPFAATALFTYCNTIMSSLELLEDFISEEDYQRMLNIADYFHQQAMASEKIKGKRLPD
jgi:hypothetical protein